MIDITQNIYDDWRTWIRKSRINGTSWDSIQYAEKSDEAGLKEFIRTAVKDMKFGDGQTLITPQEWYEIVKSEKEAEIEQQEIEERTRSAMLTDTTQDNNASISQSPRSAWQLYRKHLKDDSGFSETSVQQIEKSCFRILKRLSNDTTQRTPIKGLVIGNVQSGKTANMAGLMAMAADNGWNMFIILSGTIENLRIQTETRLTNDLNSGSGNLFWQPLSRDDLKKKANASSGQTKHLMLNDPRMKYFAVCLKNKKRLENLIKWLQGDKNAQKNLRILVIDDEADQASINTGDVTKGDAERKAINKLILNLVEGRTYNSKPCESFYRAMNYVCYTATPYANFLNENYDKSLYPQDFLIALQPSLQYFGPMQIFGNGTEEISDGMNIVRSIESIPAAMKRADQIDEFDKIKAIHDGTGNEIPDSLWDSLAWFICCVAAMRFTKYKKPISMLVHTSTAQAHHTAFAAAIKSMLSPKNRAFLKDRCKKIYIKETAAFTKSDFRLSYPDYERPQDDIPDYPDYSDIAPGIDSLLSSDVTHIPMNEEQDELHYHSGIHLCIDNCANNGPNDENMYVRLVYPSDDCEPYPSPAPAFIVIGGSTLSRGLTIQGLVSTYFARKVSQADSLMQMGRWFGYRRNYELYPRLWMLDKTAEQFEFMTQMDEELREELKLFHIMGKKPSEYGPRVKNSPKASFLRITAKNKMQSAAEVEFDFTGVRTETTSFPKASKPLKKNLDATSNFIKLLPAPAIGRKDRGYVWRGVDFNLIKNELLCKCDFATEGKVFNQLQAFLEWIDQVTAEGKLNKWNVAVAGGVCSDSDPAAWILENGVTVKKIRRNDKTTNKNPNVVVVGAVRDPKDLIIDIDDRAIAASNPSIYAKLDEKDYVINHHYQIRKESGYDKNPLLIIYLIDKDSAPSAPKDPSKEPTRRKLDTKEDVVAFSITIPGLASGDNTAKKLQIKSLSPLVKNEDDDT